MDPTSQRQPASVHTLSLSLSLPDGSSLLAPIHPRTRPFSLVARWDLPISVERPFARSAWLAYGPRMSSTTPSITSRMCSPSWTHFPTTSHAPEPFSRARAHSLAPLAQLHPQPNTLALSRSTRAPVELRCDPPSFCGRRRASVVSVALPKTRRRRARASLRPHHCSSAPEFPLEVRNSPMLLISHVLPYCSHNRSPEWFAPPLGCSATDCHSRVPLRRCRTHDRVRRAIPNLPLPLPAPRAPQRALVSGELHRGSERRHSWRSRNPGRSCRWISSVHPRSNLNHPFWIRSLECAPPLSL
jgi:hypothetical protein